MDKNVVVHIYNEILLIHRKEWIWVSFSEVDEHKACYTEWSQSEREKQISCINAYIWNLEKWYWWTYMQSRNRDADIDNRLVDAQGKKRVGWTERVALKHIHYICKIDSWREVAV